EIAFEEYRLRQQAGENPAPLEYQQRFGINIANWPALCPEPDRQPSVTPDPSPGTPNKYAGEPPHDILLAEAALAYQQMCSCQAGAAHVGLPWDHILSNGEHAQVFEDLHRADPRAAERLAQAVTRMPRAGSDFL